MKKVLFLALIGIIMISCGGDSVNTMNVSGNIKGLKKGILYLQKTVDTTLVVIDSIIIKGDGNFSFKTELKSPEIFYLYLNKKDNNTINDRIIFFGEPGIITINTIWNTFESSAKIEGSETNKKLEEYRNVMSKFNIKSLEHLRALSTPNITSLELDSIQKLDASNTVSSYRYSLNYALFNKNSFIAPYIALKEVPDANVIYLDSINKTLSKEVASSKYGRELSAYVEQLKNNK
ncbi:MAG: DUF4369 domain-containing protein [Cellulophaga sp.]